LLGCFSFAGDPIGYARVLALVSFDCHPGHLFSYIGDERCYCSSLSFPSDTTRSLSADGHSHSNDNTRSVYPQGHSLNHSAQMSLPAYPVRRRQLRTLWGSRHKDDERGQRTLTVASSKADASLSPPPGARRRPPCCHRGSDAASDPPPRLRSPRRKNTVINLALA
jgi:hypothetical protein